MIRTESAVEEPLRTVPVPRDTATVGSEARGGWLFVEELPAGTARLRLKPRQKARG